MRARTYNTKPLKQDAWAKLNFSQEKIKGFNLNEYQQRKVLLIGAGGIGSNVAPALARKGLGYLDICDDDHIEVQNLTRQLFSSKDVGKNKAVTLAKIISRQGFFQSSFTGYPFRFQEMLEDGNVFCDYDAVICAVDNNPTRVSASKFCLENGIPLIMCAVSRDGFQMYCLIQEPGQACFGCILPNAVNDDSYPCNLPGVSSRIILTEIS